MKGEPIAVEQVDGAAEWIAEARRGCRVALNLLFGACLPYLLVVAQRDFRVALRSRLDPCDVVQETLIEAYRDFPHFRGRTEKDLLSWLRQILQHNLLHERRRHIDAAMRSVRREVPWNKAALYQLRDTAQSKWKSSSEQTQAQAQSEGLEQALRQLPEHYRQVLLLHSREGLTFAEVGKRLHCSPEAARKTWGRAAKEFALAFGDAHNSVRSG